MKTVSIGRLRAAGRTIEVPFRLDIRVAEEATTLLVRRLLRLLPGKRLTAEADQNGRTVVLKLFYAARGSVRHFRRERDGLSALRKAGLATPGLLAEGEADGAPLLLLEFLPAAQPLSHLAPELQPRAAVLAAIRHMHGAGLMQKDIHPDNFLIDDNRVYCIDGDAVDASRAGHPVPAIAARDNLALFLAQFTPEESRPWLEALPEGVDEFLAGAVRRQRLIRYAHYRRKLYRDCTEIVRAQDCRRLLLLRRDADRPAMRALLNDPDHFIARGQPLKLGRSATVTRCRLDDGGTVVVKRYNVWAKPWRLLSRAFRPSRAWRSWGNAHLLHFFGVPASNPLAMLERRLGPLRGTAYFVSEYVEGEPASLPLEGLPVPPTVPEALLGLFVALKELRMTLGDTKLSNFLVCPATPHVRLIDLDDIRLHRSASSFSRAWSRDRTRFLRNFDAQPRWRAWFEAHLP